jgi:hypothetical protein
MNKERLLKKIISRYIDVAIEGGVFRERLKKESSRALAAGIKKAISLDLKKAGILPLK